MEGEGKEQSDPGQGASGEAEAPSAGQPPADATPADGTPGADQPVKQGSPREGAEAMQPDLPFAFIDGEPVTELPKDLFIPPKALSIFLDAFEGPLDFLLYLIKRQNLDVLNIPIADISRQYSGYIEVMQDLELELAGEYLVMAATLAEIKSRMLLPRPVSEEEDEGEDPRAELVRRLQEYERYKNAAERIDDLPRVERDVWPVTTAAPERPAVQRIPDVTLKEMVLAFGKVMKRAELNAHYHIRREALSVRERMSEILSALGPQEFREFGSLLRTDQGKAGVVASFLAVLELVKESLIEVVQAEEYAPIHVRARGGGRERPDDQPVVESTFD